MVYIDTSVLVAYYCPEALSDSVESILINTDNPAISHLTEVEFSSALSKKIREGNLTKDNGNKIYSMLQTHINMKSYTQLALGPQHYSKARDWISLFNTPLRTLDALHLAIAFINNLPILTADHRLADSANFLGIEMELVS